MFNTILVIQFIAQHLILLLCYKLFSSVLAHIVTHMDCNFFFTEGLNFSVLNKIHCPTSKRTDHTVDNLFIHKYLLLFKSII